MMQSKASAPPRKPSFSRDGLENSSLAQVLSQRLTNMEQQLFLLRDDLKNAVGTLKEKDREIQTLQNRITLAERRRGLEDAGKPVDESLKDLSEDIGSKSNSKRDVLQNEVVALAQKLEEMEKFFGDYGLAWVKEDALNEKDPNNLWIRKSNIHYTPDFEKVFLVVEELNLGNAEPQIVRKGNTAQFKTAQLLNLTLYADGIQLENNPFRKYDSPSVEEFFRDLEDGYFPTELKGSHPEGVIFKVKDKRTINFVDDPDKRPVISPGTKPGGKSSPSSPTSLSSLRAASRRSSISSPDSRGSSMAQADKNTEKGLLASSSRKGSSMRRGSLKKTPSRPSRSSGDVKPKNTSGEPKEKSVPTPESGVEDGKTVPASTPFPVGEDTGESGHPIDGTITGDVVKPELSPDGKQPSGDAANLQGSDGKRVDDIPGGGSLGGGISGDRSPGAVVPPASGSPQQEKPDLEGDFKELFRGKTPSSSAQRFPERSVEVTMEAQPKDSFGLPRPPFPSSSNTTADVRRLPPLGPPSKQFENFPFPKTTETQTSLTLMPGVGPGATPPTPCPQPTHVTNITYNEAPITVQMTPSEFTRTKSGGESDAAHPPTMQRRVSCPTHHPHPCNCVSIPCNPCANQEEPKEGVFGSVGLAKFPAETEYREKFTESAINNQNVLEFKKRSQEVKGPPSHSPSPTPVPRQPAATLLVGPDEAPIPPDPVPHSLIDPTVKWEHFTYMGHPKGQEAVVTPEATSRPSPKRKPIPQVVQLNEKTSDRMISVRMRTKSGSKEFLAHLNPDEPVSKVWSLLKMNERRHFLSTEDNKVIPQDTVAAEISTDQVLRIFLSKNEGSTEKTRFDPRKLPEFAAKDPEYFKTQADEEKKNRSGAKKKINDSVRHKTDARTLKDHIDEVKLLMKEDDNEQADDDDKSRDLFISPHENRDWLSKEVYSKKSVPRVPSKELEKMLEQFRSQENSATPRPREAVAGEPTIVSISESQMGTLRAAGQHPVSSPPHIVLDDTGSVISVGVPQRYKDLHEAASKSRQSISPEVDVNSSSSLISESEIHVGSYVPEPRQKMKMKNPMKPPADFPGSVSSVDLHAPSSKSSELTDFRAKSSHSLIFKRQTSAMDMGSRRRQSQSNISLKNVRLEAVHDRSFDKTDYSEKSGILIAEDMHTKNHQSIQPPAMSNQSDLERSISKESTHRVSQKARDVDIGSSGIGHDGFEAATLLEIVKAMLEAEKEHEKDQEKLRDAYRIVIPKPSPERTPQPSGFSVPKDVADELEALRQSLDKPVQPHESRMSPTQVDRAYVEQILDEIRTKRCTLDEAIRELSK